MSKRLLLFAVLIAITALASFAFVRTGASAQEKLPSRDRFIVHEWGTMTSVMGEDGVPVTWRPLSTHSDLPDFIYGMGSPKRRLSSLPNSHVPYANFNVKASLSGTVRLETPVVYFYANRNTTASVNVDFPKGNVTEWYPQGDREGTTIGWKSFLISPGAVVDLPVEKSKGEARYYAARATDSSPVRVLGTDGLQDEKFLFYRGVGTFDLPLTISLSGSLVTVGSLGAEAPVQAILFENLNGNVRYQLQDLVSNQTVFDRQASGKSLASLRGDLLKLLVGSGLYPKEAAAMIETWGDQWFEEGLRVFYIMPRKITDSVLPMTVAPSPSQLLRVLVCRAELITPEMEAAVREQVVKLGDESAEVRDAATNVLRERGRFLEPILERIQEKTEDPATRSRIDDLLARLPDIPHSN
jgi:hypothetical protein